LFVAHEMSPFLEISKISEIMRGLPQAMQEKGFEIRVLVPRFGNINERRNRLHEVIRLSGMNIVVDGNDNPLIIKVASLPAARMQVYFLDNEEYFQRKKVFRDDKGRFFADNAERSIFFCKGVLETVKKLGWAPDVVHCHGWFAAMLPAYIKTAYRDDPTFKNSKITYSLYGDEDFEPLGETYAQLAAQEDMNPEDVAVYGDGSYAELYRGALSYSDCAVFADERIDPELKAIVEETGIRHFTPAGDDDHEGFAGLFEECSVMEKAAV